MSKYDLSNFKNKIAPRDKSHIEIVASSRFTKADEVKLNKQLLKTED